MIRTKAAKRILADARHIRRTAGIHKGWDIRHCVLMAHDAEIELQDERRYERNDMRGINVDLSWMAAA